MSAHIGVVLNKNNEVLRVINPDFDGELINHALAKGERMAIVTRKAFGIGKDMSWQSPNNDLERVLHFFKVLK